MRLPTLPLALGLALALCACSSPNPDYNPAKAHHAPDGFRNTKLDSKDIGAGFWRWQWQRFSAGLAPQDASRVPQVPVDLRYLGANRSAPSMTWLGHSAALWQLGGLNVLTDPVFSQRASPVSFAGPKREQPPPVALDALATLPRIDVVLISHNHYDHLDRPTVLALAAQAGGPPLFVVPLGIDRWLRAQGIDRVRGLDWWDSHLHDGVRITLVPVQHWSARTPFDRMESLWGGFVAQAGDGFSMFYAGDTGYSADFAEIARRFPGGFDFAQIPVSCSAPRWFMRNQHVDEEEAVRIHQDVGSRYSVGVHWGTFRLCDEPVEAPIDGLPPVLARMGVALDRFQLLKLGETRVLRHAP